MPDTDQSVLVALTGVAGCSVFVTGFSAAVSLFTGFLFVIAFDASRRDDRGDGQIVIIT
jgi:hypothetical protein